MGTYETRKKKNSPSQPRHARSSYCTLRATKKPKYIITFLKDIFYKKLQQVVGVDFSPVELIITLRVFQVGLLHQILKCCGDQAILIKIDWSTSHFKKKATTNVSFFLFLITVWLNRFYSQRPTNFSSLQRPAPQHCFTIRHGKYLLRLWSEAYSYNTRSRLHLGAKNPKFRFWTLPINIFFSE